MKVAWKAAHDHVTTVLEWLRPVVAEAKRCKAMYENRIEKAEENIAKNKKKAKEAKEKKDPKSAESYSKSAANNKQWLAIFKEDGNTLLDPRLGTIPSLQDEETACETLPVQPEVLKVYDLFGTAQAPVDVSRRL